MFFKLGVLENFATFTGKHLCWSLQAFFYRTPTALLLDFRGSKYFLWAESGIYCWQSHRFLFRTPLKHDLNLRSSHWNSSLKKFVLRNFANFTGKLLCWNPFLIELQLVCSFIKQKLRHRHFPGEFTKFLRTPNFKSANDCFWNLFFHLDCPF